MQELQNNILLNAASKGEVANPADIAFAANIVYVNPPLRLLGYGKKPITDWLCNEGMTMQDILSFIHESRRPQYK